MDGIYSELSGIAEMQMDLINDCEPVPPISDINYYAGMAEHCEKWNKQIAKLIAVECVAYAFQFARENDYHVVKLTDCKVYTQVDLYETCEVEGKACLVHKLCLCATTESGVSTILSAYQSQYGKLILV